MILNLLNEDAQTKDYSEMGSPFNICITLK